MPGNHCYLPEIKLDEDGRHVVSFTDFGWGGDGTRHP